MKKINSIIIIMLLIFLTSCVDDSKNPLPDFGNSKGAFARFTNNIAPPTISFADPVVAGFIRNIEDVNNNIQSYKLSLTATVSGSTLTANDILEITNFPADLNITAQLLADSLGLTLDDLNFGDNFAFRAVITRNDGVQFFGVAPNYDATTGIFNGGNTSPTVLSGGGLKGAMAFNFTLACPQFDINELVGFYSVQENGLDTGLNGSIDDPDPIREVILGPAEGQITIVGGELPWLGSEDLIVNVDTSTGSLTLGLNASGGKGLAFPAGAEGIGFESDYDDFNNGALALTCLTSGVNTLDMTVNLTCCAFPHRFFLTKI